MEEEKVIVAKISDGKQKRITIPKQKETEDWSKGDLIKLKKIEIK